MPSLPPYPVNIKSKHCELSLNIYNKKRSSGGGMAHTHEGTAADAKKAELTATRGVREWPLG